MDPDAHSGVGRVASKQSAALPFERNGALLTLRESSPVALPLERNASPTMDTESSSAPECFSDSDGVREPWRARFFRSSYLRMFAHVQVCKGHLSPPPLS